MVLKNFYFQGSNGDIEIRLMDRGIEEERGDVWKK